MTYAQSHPCLLFPVVFVRDQARHGRKRLSTAKPPVSTGGVAQGRPSLTVYVHQDRCPAPTNRVRDCKFFFSNQDLFQLHYSCLKNISELAFVMNARQSEFGHRRHLTRSDFGPRLPSPWISRRDFGSSQGVPHPVRRIGCQIGSFNAVVRCNIGLDCSMNSPRFLGFSTLYHVCKLERFAKKPRPHRRTTTTRRQNRAKTRRGSAPTPSRSVG